MNCRARTDFRLWATVKSLASIGLIIVGLRTHESFAAVEAAPPTTNARSSASLGTAATTRTWVTPLGMGLLYDRHAFETGGSSIPGMRRFQKYEPWHLRGPFANGAGPQSFVSPVSVGGDHVIVATLGGGVGRYDISQKRYMWRLDLDIGVASEVAVMGSSLIVAGMDATVRRLRADTGQEEWRVKLSSESLGGVTGNMGFVYVTTSDDVLYALEESTGKEVWSYRRPRGDDTVFWSLRGHSKPVLSPDGARVYTGFSDGFFVAIDAVTGRTRWERNFQRAGRFRDADITPVLSRDGKMLYFPLVDGDLLALQTEDGKTAWKFPDVIAATPLLDEAEGVIYFVNKKGFLHKVKLSDQQILWKVMVEESQFVSAPMSVGQNGVSLCGSNEACYLFSKKDGARLWREYVGQKTVAAPAFADGRLLVLTPRNELLIYRVDENL